MKILVITSRVPYPLDKGDKLRVYHQIKHLAKNQEVILCCLDDTQKAEAHHLNTICKTHIFPLSKPKILVNLFFALFSDKPFQVSYFYQKKAHKHIADIIKKEQPDRIFCQLIRTSEYVKNYIDITKTIDYMDAFSKGMGRRLNNAKWWERPFVKAEQKRLLRYENLMFDYFEHHTIISEQDRDLIFHKQRQQIHVVPNGVDVDYFTPQNIPKRYDIAFVGNLNYPPNILACQFLVQKVLPLLPGSTTLILSGATPHKDVLALEAENITVQGWVDDIRSVYSSAKLFIAPMLTGTGLQNKLLEAMSMQLPCVTTKLVNDALKATPDEHLKLAQSPEDFAAVIIELLNNSEKANVLAKNGQNFVKKEYSWQKFNKNLEDIIVSD